MNTITTKQAYYTMFFMLDKYYESNPFDDLGSLLGDISPFIFGGSKSADPAAFEDFEEILNADTGSQDITFENAFNAVKLFLGKYENDFEYNLGKIIGKLTFEGYLNAFKELETSKNC